MTAINIRRRAQEDLPHRRRSVLVSPDWAFSPPGSRFGGFSLSWSQLRQLAQLSPTVQAVIALRQAQISSFARQPRHKGDRGIEVVRADDPGSKTAHDEKVEAYVFRWLMEAGKKEAWERKRFPMLLRAALRDLLIVGAAAIEKVFDEDGILSEIWCIDSATIELQWAERYIPTTRYGKDMDQPVRYVQVVDGQIETEYAEDELIYLQMNSPTDITNGGYAIGPTQAMADWIAAEVLALQYNSNYFDHGSVPPGILAMIGNMSSDTMDALNSMWEVDVKGVVGQHKPVALAVEPSPNGGSSIQWLPMKQSNRDMEMGDFLDKLTTRISSGFLTDPIEIGQRTASNTGGISGSDNTEAKIDLSRDKGLLPILDLFEEMLNHHIMPYLAPGYVVRFTGINAEDEEAKVKYLNLQMAGGALTGREWRKAMGLEESPPGTEKAQKWLDAPANPQLLQVWVQENGMQPQQAGAPGEESGKPPKPKMAAQTGENDDAVDKSWAAY